MNEMHLKDFLDLPLFSAYLVTLNSSFGHNWNPLAFSSQILIHGNYITFNVHR